jgi:hypothetical protein
MSKKECNGCGGASTELVRLPYDVFMAFYERTIKRMWVLCILLIILLVGTNAAWLIYESQFETAEETYQEVIRDADGGGDNSFIGGDYYGETNHQDENN